MIYTILQNKISWVSGGKYPQKGIQKDIYPSKYVLSRALDITYDSKWESVFAIIMMMGISYPLLWIER